MRVIILWQGPTAASVRANKDWPAAWMYGICTWRAISGVKAQPWTDPQTFPVPVVDVPRACGNDTAEAPMRLYGGDHARHNIRPPQYSLVHFQQTGPRQAGQFSQQLAIEQEIAPKPFGHREHELPMGHGGTNVFRDVKAR